MGLFSGVRKKVEETAQGLFEKSPFLFSHLAAPIKRGAYERDIFEAEEAERRRSEMTATVASKRQRVEGLKKQLTDEKGNGIYYAFADTNGRAYQKLLR